MKTQTQDSNAQAQADTEDHNESVELHVARTDRKNVIPLAIVQWLAMQTARYQDTDTRGHTLDPQRIQKHPDAIALGKDFSGLSMTSIERIAWLLWRARQVQFWTRDLNKDTYTKTPAGLTILKHRGVNVHKWADCLDAAYLGKGRSALHDAAFNKRDAYYVERNRREEEMELAALTRMRITTEAQEGNTGESTTEKNQTKANRAKANRAKARREAQK